MSSKRSAVSAPNTMLSSDFLSEKVIICCGEDEREMMSALLSSGVTKPLRQLKFRSYQIRKYLDFTVILAGIGTGCLEPLLHELLSFGITKSLVLTGTAARTSGSAASLGEVYIIKEAYLAGTALDREIKSYPLTPSFHLVDGFKDASIVSTDFYYGFSEAVPGSRYHEKLEHLQRDVAKYVKKVDLVDMEVGQFYALCDLLSYESTLEYIAVKGPANSLSHYEEQVSNTHEVLSKGFRAAFDLLGISSAPQSPLDAHVVPSNESVGDSSKMVEEIKLYWTIQIASASILGFIANNLDFYDKVSTCILCLTAFILLTIGAIYNLTGNYYIRLEGERLGLGSTQENVIAPHLCVIYWAISAIIGGVFGYCLGSLMSPYYASVLMIFCALSGWAFVYIAELRTFRELYRKGSSGYRKYSEFHRKLFGPWRHYV